jgi:hypothetical protein
VRRNAPIRQPTSCQALFGFAVDKKFLTALRASDGIEICTRAAMHKHQRISVPDDFHAQEYSLNRYFCHWLLSKKDMLSCV